MQAVKDNQHHPWRDALDNNTSTTRSLHPLHIGPGPDGNECTPLKGCASTSGDRQEAPSAFWTVWKPRPLHSHHEVMPTMMTTLAHPETMWPHPSCTHATTMLRMCPNVTLYVHTETMQPTHSEVEPYAHTATAQPYARKVTMPPSHTQVAYTATTATPPTPLHAHPTLTTQPMIALPYVRTTTMQAANPVMHTAPPAHLVTLHIKVVCTVTAIMPAYMCTTAPHMHAATTELPLHMCTAPHTHFPMHALATMPPTHSTTHALSITPPFHLTIALYVRTAYIVATIPRPLVVGPPPTCAASMLPDPLLVNPSPVHTAYAPPSPALVTSPSPPAVAPLDLTTGPGMPVRYTYILSIVFN